VQISGRWALTHEVQGTSYQPFQGLRLGYEVTLVQDGNRVHGRGRKVSENGAPLPVSQRTPIDVEGRIEGGQVVLSFTEMGAARMSHGTIRWQLTRGGDADGEFSSDVADSRGSSSGHRLR
jgi:hypothetical protein